MAGVPRMARDSKLYLSELQEERKAGRELFFIKNGMKWSVTGVEALYLACKRYNNLGVLLPQQDRNSVNNWLRKRKGTVR